MMRAGIRSRHISVLATAVVMLGSAGWAQTGSSAQSSATGTITGRIRLTGKPPANDVIKMTDAACLKINAGKRVVQEAVLVSPDGGLAGVFVHLEGSFPQTPVPIEAVTIDQQGCVYRPRVVGARVGQALVFKNSDPTLHNVHSVASKVNPFNIGQPMQGMTSQVKGKGEEVMMRVGCQPHPWMILYVGLVAHPYFAVTADSGTFTISGVPAGKHTVRVWHERFGAQTRPTEVKAGAKTVVDLSYVSP